MLSKPLPNTAGALCWMLLLRNRFLLTALCSKPKTSWLHLTFLSPLRSRSQNCGKGRCKTHWRCTAERSPFDDCAKILNAAAANRNRDPHARPDFCLNFRLCHLFLEAIPFIVSAMGSHGEGTESGQRAVLAGYGIKNSKSKPDRSLLQNYLGRGLNHRGKALRRILMNGRTGEGRESGQRAVLAGYGITEERMGVPVVTSMDTVPLGQCEHNLTVWSGMAST